MQRQPDMLLPARPPALEPLEPRVLLDAAPLITELMASNRDTLRDSVYGEAFDWIELHNPGEAPVDLTGWTLRDGDENVWPFPPMLLAPGEYRVLFASDKDIRDPAGELHTNFGLKKDGEYLGLYDDEGSVVHEYYPSYPAQTRDVSYGPAFEMVADTLAGPGSDVAVLVPDGPVPEGWKGGSAFDDSGWLAGTLGVGYSGGAYGGLVGLDVQDAMEGINSSAYLRVPFEAQGPASYQVLRLRMKYNDGFVAYVNGSEVARRNAPESPTWDSSAPLAHGSGATNLLAQDFDGAGTPYTASVFGSWPEPEVLPGGPDGRFLRLAHDGAGNNINRVAFDDVHGAAASRVVADYDFRFHSDGSPADGLSFLLLPTWLFGASGPGSDDTYHSEEPNLSETFAVAFDLYPNANDVSVHWDGAVVQNVAVATGGIDLTAGVFHHAHVELAADAGGSRVTVTLTPDVFGSPGPDVTVVDDCFVAGLAPYDARVEFSARTGGATCDMDLDNVAVSFTSPAGADEYEDIDLTGYLHLLHEGTNVLAIHGLNVRADDGDFLILPELASSGEATIHLDRPRFFEEPTPGQPNTPGLVGSAGGVGFSSPGGTFSASLSLALTGDVPDATIRYTLDGSPPTEASARYDGAIPIGATTLVRARALKDGASPGAIHSETYVKLDADVQDFTSNLPLIVVDNFAGGSVPANDFQPAYVGVFEPPEGGRTSLTGDPQVATRAGLKIRGSSTAGRPKKSYAFEAWDERDEDKDIAPLDMPGESDWILYGPYNFDRALIRNAFIYELSNQIGRYAVRCRFVEVFVNTDGGALSYGDYAGVYVLMEKIKRDDDRVDVPRLDPEHHAEPEVTGGYIFKIDRRDPGDSGFYAGGQSLCYVYPKEENITADQRAYLKGYIDEFADVLYGPDFADPVDGYAKYIDVDSWIDHNLLNMLPMNVDAFRLSAFFYKDREGKIEAGPIWDFDRSMESTDGRDNDPETWHGTGDSSHYVTYDSRYPWWGRLLEDPDFWQRYKDRWALLRRGELSDENIAAIIDTMAARLDEAQERNFQRWSSVAPRNGSWPWEIEHMKDWLLRRAAWVDSQFGPLPEFGQDGGLIEPGFELTVTASTGTVYYTLDGSDPRLPGGQPNPGAVGIATGGGGEVVTLVPKHATWKYLDVGSYAGNGWQTLGFNDESWKSGPAELGYGDGNEATVVDYGPDRNHKYTTTYFRHVFEVEDASAIDELTLGLMRDDGAVLYLNGQALPPVHMPSGPIAYDTWANATVGGGDESTYYAVPVSSDLLVEGWNILAVEIHQANRRSSDISFDLELKGLIVTVPDEGTVVLDDTVLLRARTRVGDEWSVLAEAFFETGETPSLAVTEINYNPYPPTPEEVAAGFTNNDDFEFIEVRNLGNRTVNVTTLRFTEGIAFRFGGSGVISLDPGDYAVVVSNREAFRHRYGTDVPVAGEHAGLLCNDGDRIALTYGVSNVLLDFVYNDAGSWPGRADGNGWSIELTDPAATTPEDYADPDRWRSAIEYGGSPGRQGIGRRAGVVINEVLTHTDPPLADAIELYNPTGGDIDISGWYLSDTTGDYLRFRIPDATVLRTGAYAAFDEDDFNASGGIGPSDFALSSAHGDDVWLLEADADGKLTRFVDHVEFGAAANGESFGRWPNGEGDLYPMAWRTLGEGNDGPRVGPLILSEVHADPDVEGAADDYKFVEVYNPTGEEASLAGWRTRKDVDYDFDDSTAIAPFGTVVVVAFDPEDDDDKAADFRDAYGIGESVQLVGGYSDVLGGERQRVQLQRPDEPPAEEWWFTPHLLEDEVRTFTEAPWPTGPAGESLHRLSPTLWGSDPSHWGSGPPSPGAFTPPSPALLNFQRNDGADRPSELGSLALGFSQDVSGSLDADDLAIHNDSTGEDVDLAQAVLAYDAQTNTARWDLSAVAVAPGYHTATLSADEVTNAGGLPLAGEGITAEEYEIGFLVAAPGDVDLDGEVSRSDFLALRGHFGQPDAGWSGGDFDDSGAVDALDYVALKRHVGTALSPAPAESTAAAAEPLQEAVTPPQNAQAAPSAPAPLPAAPGVQPVAAAEASPVAPAAAPTSPPAGAVIEAQAVPTVARAAPAAAVPPSAEARREPQTEPAPSREASRLTTELVDVLGACGLAVPLTK